MSSADYLRTTAADMRAKMEPRHRQCSCSDTTSWFDRTFCPEPCGGMHDICEECGLKLGHCAVDALPPRQAPFVLAVAEWLEAAAVTYEEMRAYYSQGTAEEQAMAAMAVARAWNGEA